MLFPRNALASEPQAYFYPGKRIEKVKVGKHIPSTYVPEQDQFIP
jgi:hypothetical protein